MFGIYVVKSVWFFKIQTIKFVGATVEDDVAFGLENQGLSRQEMKKRVEEALDLVGMLDFKKREPARLSGGQKATCGYCRRCSPKTSDSNPR